MYNRKYVSGTSWCFWRWTQVDSEYIRRLHVLKTPWFAICLHWILKPDPEPFLHDHPVSFLSIILRGGYGEKRWNTRIGHHYRYNKWVNWIRASKDDRHTIVMVKPRTLTLCLMGPKRMEWGFHVPDGLLARVGRTPTERLRYDHTGTLHPIGRDNNMWKDYYARQREHKKLMAEADRNGGVIVRYPANIKYTDGI